MSIRKRYPVLTWVIVDLVGLVLFTFFAVNLVEGLSRYSLNRPEVNTFIGCLALYVIASAYLYQPHIPSGFKTLANVIPTITALFGILVLIVIIFRIGYSRSLLLVFFGLFVLWFQIRVLMALRWSYKYFWVIPQGNTKELLKLRGRVSCKELQSVKPRLASTYQDGIVVDFRSKIDDSWNQLITQASLKGVPIYDVATIYESISGRISIQHIAHGHLDIALPSRVYLYLKRFLDLLLASLLLALSLPLLILITLLIKVDSSGPVFFTQQRIGRGGDVFDMLKFRTMNKKTSSRPFQSSTQSQDKRITRIGLFLRYFHLDELPQLWNVIKGDMSVVGPRPAVAENQETNNNTIPFYPHRHMVRPGITGWAQVSQGYALDEDISSTREKTERDFYYIKHMSPWLDTAILMMTVITVLLRRGAR